ncbi:MAG TPA: acyltransferase [Solirubrobacterales bacterium]|nr:acyltransferase [Solirubrobacterales bacterium]
MSKEAQRRFAALDGLRGIAALMVFAIHVWIYQLPNTVVLRRDSWEKTLLFEGRVAFVMFFVLSGYLLYRAFARAALGQGKAVNVRSYLVRRAARIVPAYYVAILGTLALLWAAGDVPGRRLVDAAQLPLYFVFGQNYTPDTLLKLNAATWTLAVEVVFYLMLPVIGWLALRWCRGRVGRQALLLAGLAATGLAWNAVDYSAGWGPVASHSPPSFLPYFACGMLVALLVEWRRARGSAPLGTGASAALVGGAAAVLVLNGWWHATFAHDSVAMEVLADSGAALAFAAIIAALVLGTGTGVRWLGARPLAWMGEITYGFYLWHIPLLVCARGLGILPSGIVLGLAVLPVAIAFGAASWHWIEQPFMRRAARLPRGAAEASGLAGHGEPARVKAGRSLPATNYNG